MIKVLVNIVVMMRAMILLVIAVSCHYVMALGLRVMALGCRVEGLGFRVLALGFSALVMPYMGGS